MLIDMDDTILSAYGRPEIAWNNVRQNSPANLRRYRRNTSPRPSWMPGENSGRRPNRRGG
jgi:hypothetical protein